MIHIIWIKNQLVCTFHQENTVEQRTKLDWFGENGTGYVLKLWDIYCGNLRNIGRLASMGNIKEFLWKQIYWRSLNIRNGQLYIDDLWT